MNLSITRASTVANAPNNAFLNLSSPFTNGHPTKGASSKVTGKGVSTQTASKSGNDFEDPTEPKANYGIIIL